MPTLSIDLTPQQANRIQAALGKHWNLSRDANAAEVREAVVRFLRNLVAEIENDEARRAVIVPPLDIA